MQVVATQDRIQPSVDGDSEGEKKKPLKGRFGRRSEARAELATKFRSAKPTTTWLCIPRQCGFPGVKKKDRKLFEMGEAPASRSTRRYATVFRRYTCARREMVGGLEYIATHRPTYRQLSLYIPIF